METIEKKLLTGETCLMDKDLWEEIGTLGFSIYANGNGYVQITGHHLLHHWIMHPPKGMTVDHINGNSLDNRRVNLRVVSQLENCGNRHSPVVSQTGYRNVTRKRNRPRPYRTEYKYNDRSTSRSFFSLHVAALIADRVRCEIWSVPGRLNFPYAVDGSDVENIRRAIYRYGGLPFTIVYSSKRDGTLREDRVVLPNNEPLAFNPPVTYLGREHVLLKTPEGYYRCYQLSRILCLETKYQRYWIDYSKKEEG